MATAPDTTSPPAAGRHRPARLPRTVAAAGAALLVATAASLGLLLVLRTALDLVGRTDRPRVDEVVTVLCALVALAAAVWFVLGVLLEVLAHLPGRVGAAARHLATRVAPPATRRLAAVVVGAVTLATLAPADAVGEAPPTAPAPEWGAGDGASDSLLDPLPPPDAAPEPGFVPTRPTVRPQADPRLVAAPVSGPALVDQVVVRRGDTLWSIARDHLGAGATDAEVAAAWPRWHAANRAVIGDDPDLILPGQVLAVPNHEAPVPQLTPSEVAR